MAELEKAGDIAAAKTERLKSNSDKLYCEVCQSDTHSTAGHGENGGARKGAGRPRGSENKQTKERRAALERFKERVENHADRLFNAQANLATGEQYLFCIVTTTDSKGKTSKRTEVVTDLETIKAYLDDTLDVGDDEYYYLSTKPANNMAIDSLLNRAFGTPQKSVDLTTKGQSILDRMDDKDVQRIASALGAALNAADDDTE